MSEKWRMGLIVVCLAVIGAFIWNFTARDAQIKPKSSSSPEQVQQPAAAAPTPNSGAQRGTRTLRTTPPNTQEVVESIALDGSGIIRGKVKMAEGGPIPEDLVVNLYRAPKSAADHTANAEILSTAMIGEDATFTFAKLPFRGYTLIAKAEGFTGSQHKALTEKYPESKIELTVHPSLFMSGTVKDTRGVAVTMANVYIAGMMYQNYDMALRDSGLMAIGVRTNERGEFHLDTITNRYPDGQFRLAAAATGFATNYSDQLPVGSTGIKIILQDAGFVSGRVVHRDSGEPLPNTELAAVGDDRYLPHIQTDTDDDGAFTLTGLATGKYELVLPDNNLKITGATRNVELAADESIQDLVVEASEGALLSGRVYDSDTDKGIRGVKITAVPQGVTYSSPAETMTDRTGKYSFAGLYEAQYRISHDEVPGYPRNQHDDDKKVITSLDKPTTGVDFPFSKGISIYGTVVDENGEPLPKISVSGMTDGTPIYDRKETSDQGTFVLAGFKSDTKVNLTAEGKEFYHDRHELEIYDTDITGVVIKLNVAARISGKLVYSTDEPAPKKYLNTGKQVIGNVLRSMPARSGKDGAFTFNRLKPGTHTITLLPGGFDSSIEGEALTTVTVRAGEHLKNLRLVVPGTPTAKATISGQITDDTGAPVQGVNIYASRKRGGGFINDTPSSNADGRYSITVEAGETYSLNFSAKNHAQKSVENIAAGTTTADVTLNRTGSISGTVVEADTGEPIPGFGLSLRYGEMNMTIGRQYRDFYDGAGRFTMNGVNPALSGFLYARAKGYADAAIPIFGVRSGETLDGIVIEMTAPYAVAGRVTDKAGNPIQGAWIYRGEMPSHDPQGEYKSAATNAQGEFTLNDMASGEHLLIATKEGFLTREITVQLQQPVSTIDIVLGDGATLTGVVTLGGEPQPNVMINGAVFEPGTQKSIGDIQAQTDSEGRYSAGALPGGKGMLFARLSVEFGSKSMRRDFDVVLDMETEVNFVFENDSGIIEGVLLENDGSPATGRVAVQLTSERGNAIEQTMVGEDGAFRFESLPPGRFLLSGMSGQNQGSPKVVHGELGDNETRQVEIVLNTGAALDVTLLNTPPDEEVYAILLIGGTVIPVLTNVDDFSPIMSNILHQAEMTNGLVTLQNIDPGTYEILVVAPEEKPMRTAVTTITIPDDTRREVELSF
jgi:hypothetical protein